jgi:hypothetical protein
LKINKDWRVWDYAAAAVCFIMAVFVVVVWARLW